jgi:hypothetical protein
MELCSFEGVWGSSSSDVFVVGVFTMGGTAGTVWHYDGSSWANMQASENGTITAVWGTSFSDVYAVGANGTILHYGP